jgi:hypothetical protein
MKVSMVKPSLKRGVAESLMQKPAARIGLMLERMALVVEIPPALNPTFTMPDKHNHSGKSVSRKSVLSHGNFKHTAKPARLKAVLGAYGLKRADYERVRSLVFKDLGKVPVHAR